ncbi:hypothetical protein [Sulfurirhabdus autotrophica]|uniref:Uncharacterized protein n=1 Tax=Sulfurirhabdus autotrophica TaxID=1706046 RepID=A0A4R3YBX2_9PROT|nr:hypothetical protein [Sulfurirhabdus autotrophica]TCV89557.1 hypothetical protein EDC63_10275 [Sulfurirhabdus autotrophica]
MLKLVKLLLSVSLFMTSITAFSDTRTDVGVSIGNGGISNFYLAIGEYYRVPEREVVFIRERRIPDYDIPVVLFLAERARVEPEVIIDYRLRGRSWMDITLHFGLDPQIYYVPVREVYGPPYGHAYGHYKNKNKRKIRLDDDDVVNMVNLRFISERYGYAPEEVMRMRSRGDNFIVINEDVRRSKKDKYYDKRDKEWDKRERKEMKERNKEWKHQGKGRDD